MEEQNYKNVRIALDSPRPGRLQHAYLGYKQQIQHITRIVRLFTYLK